MPLELGEQKRHLSYNFSSISQYFPRLQCRHVFFFLGILEYHGVHGMFPGWAGVLRGGGGGVIRDLINDTRDIYPDKLWSLVIQLWNWLLNPDIFVLPTLHSECRLLRYSFRHTTISDCLIYLLIKLQVFCPLLARPPPPPFSAPSVLSHGVDVYSISGSICRI